MRSRIAFGWVAAVLASGCGLLIGLEERELPADGADAAVADVTTKDTSTATDTGVDTGSKDSAADVVTDAGSDVDASDACACATGCNADGVCLDEIVSIGVGAKHACIVRADGKAFCTGDNEFFQLATNAVASSETWVPVSVSSGGAIVPLREIAVGPASNCAIARDGDLYCWGKNSFDNISADASAVVVSTPTKVDLAGLKVKALSVGHQATCVIVDVAGTAPNVRCWGHSSSGDLGLGFDTTAGGDAGPYVQAPPQTVPGLRAKSIHVLAGDGEGLGRACAIKEDDLPVCWGGTPNEEITSPVPGTTCDPTGSGAFACALGATSWGSNPARDIGNGRDDVCAIETAPDGGADASANRLRCRGVAGVLALDDQCAVTSGGFDVRVGDGGPKPVRLASGLLARCLVDDESDVWCFGSNDTLQSGREGSDPCVDGGSIPPDRRPSVPLRVTFFPDGGSASSGEGAALKAKLLAVGRGGALVYTTDRKLVGWGANQNGELGARPASASDTSSCNGVDGRCQGPTLIPLPAFP